MEKLFSFLELEFLNPDAIQPDTLKDHESDSNFYCAICLENQTSNGIKISKCEHQFCR